MTSRLLASPGHQDVDVVVDHQRDLDRVHRLQLDHAR
jgi:hypothetical protein